MKFLTKIKSIYLLAIVAILSFCMVLFPALPSFANATEGEEPESGTEVVLPEDGGETEGEEPEIVVPEETVEMGTGDVKIVLARSVVQNYTGEGAFKDKVNQWAIMFGAHIEKAEYDKITQNDTALVKFGMLIGPTKLLDYIDLSSATTGKAVYDKLVTGVSLTEGGAKLSFESFSYVGSSKSDGQDLGKMFNEKGVAEYLGGIVYDQTKLLDNSIAYSALELTAIPFYMNANDASEATNIVVDYDVDNDVFGSAKSAVPRNVLVENYLRQDVGNETVPGDEVEIDISTIQTFVAQVNALTYKNDEAYICRSTNRVMVGAEQAELKPLEMATDGNTTSAAFAGKAVVATGVVGGDDLLDETFVQGLPMYKEGVSGQGYFVIYGANSITVYVAKVAERVIMRFADTHTGNLKVVDGAQAYGSTKVDETKEYLANATLVLSGSTISRREYQSIFSYDTNVKKLQNGSTLDIFEKNASMTYRAPTESYDGLYVLGAHIENSSYISKNTSNHNYVLDKASTASAGYHNNANHATSNATGADNDRARNGYVAPAAGIGFIGVFDGRGMTISMGNATQGYKAVNGVLPPAFGATIKNVAVYGLTQQEIGGGITASARNTKFENIYAEVVKTTYYNADLNKGILMNIQNCELTNFVASVNTVDSTVMTGTLPAYKAGNAGSGVGQGITTSGVFNFRAFPELYYDKDDNVVRGAISVGQFNTPYFSSNISSEEIKEYFPNMINKAGKAEFELFNTSQTNNFVVAPLANNYGRMENPEQANEFTGTTGQNVYAIGSSPLYVAYDYIGEYRKSGSTEYFGTQLGATTLATVFVNQAPKLVDTDEEVELGWKEVRTTNTVVNEETGEESEVEVLTYEAPKSYLMSQIAGDLFKFDAEDGVYSLGEIIYRGKLFRHGATRMENLLGGSSAADTLEVRFVSQAGFYDVADAEEMAKYLTEGNAKLFKASGFWTVTETETADGKTYSVVWKNVAA